jgi:hypothetical protein
MMGDDLFEFYVISVNGIYSIIPAGGPNDVNGFTCGVGASGGGSGCTYTRLFNPNGLPQ